MARTVSSFGPAYPVEGAGGGGTTTDLADLPFGNAVDLTDGSWTLLDPDSLVKSTSHTGGLNTVTFNALGTGDNDYVVASNHADFRPPRWYRPLNIGTTRVHSSAPFIWNSILDIDESTFDFNSNVAHGVCADPTSTTRSAIEAMGSLFTRSASGSWRYGSWTGDSSNVPGASSSYARVTAVGQYGAGHIGSVMHIVLNASNERVQNGSKNGSHTLSDTDLFEIVTVGTFNSSATIDDGDTIKIKCFLGAVRFGLP